jgi:hypothetical protein
MVEPADAKELIDEAIERAEAAQQKQEASERAVERQFRDRVSVLVGVFAVLLAIIHVVAAGNARESIARNIEASDDFAYMQAKIIRETVLKSSAAATGLAPADRDAMLSEATRLRHPDKAGHGIGQLQASGEHARESSVRAAEKSERYEWGETALQVAIVLLSIALVARSGRIVIGASGLAVAGVAIVIATQLGLV